MSPMSPITFPNSSILATPLLNYGLDHRTGDLVINKSVLIFGVYGVDINHHALPKIATEAKRGRG